MISGMTHMAVFRVALESAPMNTTAVDHIVLLRKTMVKFHTTEMVNRTGKFGPMDDGQAQLTCKGSYIPLPARVKPSSLMLWSLWAFSFSFFFGIYKFILPVPIF